MNYFIHLTNNAVQMTSKSYGSEIQGNILGLTELEVTSAQPALRQEPRQGQPRVQDRLRRQALPPLHPTEHQGQLRRHPRPAQPEWSAALLGALRIRLHDRRRVQGVAPRVQRHTKPF